MDSKVIEALNVIKNACEGKESCDNCEATDSKLHIKCTTLFGGKNAVPANWDLSDLESEGDWNE